MHRKLHLVRSWGAGAVFCKSDFPKIRLTPKDCIMIAASAMFYTRPIACLLCVESSLPNSS